MSFCYDLMIVFLIISLQSVERGTLMRARFTTSAVQFQSAREDENLTKLLFLWNIFSFKKHVGAAAGRIEHALRRFAGWITSKARVAVYYGVRTTLTLPLACKMKAR